MQRYTYGEVAQFCILPLLAVIIMLLARAVLGVKEKYNKRFYEKLLEKRIEYFKPSPLLESEPTVGFQEIPAVPDIEDNFNFAKVDYLSLATNQKVLSSAVDCIRKYGVGTCGPRAFYGGTDVHLLLEKRLSEFLNKEDAIVYAYGYTTISSSIHCYCKPDTVVFVDEFVNCAIQQGIAASRCRQIIFKHNDVEDFADKVKMLWQSELIFDTLKYLVVEGIYANDGSMCPFPHLLKVCREYKVRILMDESISFGVLGEHGRGVMEHFDVDVHEVDVTIGSLEHAFASYGGFCIGSKATIEHQRLSSTGYTFSASLPTYSAQAVITVLDLIDDRPRKLRALSVNVHDFLSSIPEFLVKSHRESPMKVFCIKNDEKQFYMRRLNEFFMLNHVYMLESDDGLKMHLYVDLCESHKSKKFFEIVKKAVNRCLDSHD